jgi:hypothetical protein
VGKLSRRREVSQPSGLREAITSEASHHPLNGSLKVNPVPDRDIDRFYAPLCPQSRPDNLTLIEELCVISRLLP